VFACNSLIMMSSIMRCLDYVLMLIPNVRQGGCTVPEYEGQFMELFRYAPHLNTEKLKVKKFMFGLNINIHVKVRILLPQIL
jgi:hypothetical protein